VKNKALHNVRSAYGWALIWLPDKQRKGFVAGFSFKATRREVVTEVIEEWANAREGLAEGRRGIWKRIQAAGGRAVRVEMREILS
jgi:hypothetical protein